MKKTQELLAQLLSIIRRLRGPGGCPWDRKQTPGDVKTYLVEELYELLEAIDRDEPALLAEESGDLLFMILFLVNLYEERQLFTLDEALAGIKAKMVHRHPHVFSDTTVGSVSEVKRNWQVLKEKEGKKQKTSQLDGIPANLPALLQAGFLTAKAAEVGFDWQNARQVLDKVKEEISELEESLSQANPALTAGETGDLLFSIVNLSRHLKVDPEQALRGTNRKFEKRFKYLESALQQQGKTLQQATLEEMDALWEEAKTRPDR